MSVTCGDLLSPSQLRRWALTGVFASISACGDNVTVQQSQGVSSSTSSSTSTSTGIGAGASTTTAGNGGGLPGATGSGGSTSSGALGDGGTCNPVLAPEQMMEMGCFQSTSCPLKTDASAREQLTLALGFCNQEKTPCCEKTVVDQVACGPVKQEADCCYVVVYSTFHCGE